MSCFDVQNGFFQLLDLMHTLHTRAATIFSSWAEEERHRLAEPREPYLEGLPGIDAGTSTLWTKCWCPLLQGIKFLGLRWIFKDWWYCQGQTSVFRIIFAFEFGQSRLHSQQYNYPFSAYHYFIFHVFISPFLNISRYCKIMLWFTTSSKKPSPYVSAESTFGAWLTNTFCSGVGELF